MTFKEAVVNDTIEKLLRGEDYREAIFRSIDGDFFDFSITFFKEIVKAKFNSDKIDLDWYKIHFLSHEFSKKDIAVFGGVNVKSISNIKKSATKEIVLSFAEQNFEYLNSLLLQMCDDSENGIGISISLKHNGVTVELNLTESLLIINALATKKLQIRGGAWSAIGKKVEKPLIDRLCCLVGVPKENIDNSHFKKDKSKAFDREVDYKLISNEGKIYRIEVKLMGAGNPESADATIARASDIFIADTLSDMNKKQLESRKVEWLELKGNDNTIVCFKNILDRLGIPHV